MTSKLELATDALYVSVRVAETCASLVVSFPEPDDELAERQKKYVRTMTCVGVLYQFDRLLSDQRRAWTNALSECLTRRDSPTYEDVMKALREASERSSGMGVRGAFGSTIYSSANSLDKRVKDELGVTDLREPLTFGFVGTQFASDGPGMEVQYQIERDSCEEFLRLQI